MMRSHNTTDSRPRGVELDPAKAPRRRIAVILLLVIIVFGLLSCCAVTTLTILHGGSSEAALLARLDSDYPDYNIVKSETREIGDDQELTETTLRLRHEQRSFFFIAVYTSEPTDADDYSWETSDEFFRTSGEYGDLAEEFIKAFDAQHSASESECHGMQQLNSEGGIELWECALEANDDGSLIETWQRDVETGAWSVQSD